jgi:hypothetical protein
MDTVWALIRAGKLPRPWIYRRRRAFWAPEQVAPAVARYRRRKKSNEGGPESLGILGPELPSNLKELDHAQEAA